MGGKEDISRESARRALQNMLYPVKKCVTFEDFPL